MSRKADLLNSHADIVRMLEALALRSISLRGRDVRTMQVIQKNLLECQRALEEMMNATKEKNSRRNK